MNPITRLTLRAMISDPGPRRVARDLALRAYAQNVDAERLAGEVHATFSRRLAAAVSDPGDQAVMRDSMNEVDWIALARILLETAEREGGKRMDALEQEAGFNFARVGKKSPPNPREPTPMHAILIALAPDPETAQAIEPHITAARERLSGVLFDGQTSHAVAASALLSLLADVCFREPDPRDVANGMGRALLTSVDAALGHAEAQGPSEPEVLS